MPASGVRHDVRSQMQLGVLGHQTAPTNDDLLLRYNTE